MTVTWQRVGGACWVYTNWQPTIAHPPSVIVTLLNTRSPKKNNPKKQKAVDTSAFREDWRRTVKSEEGAGVGVQVELKVPALTHNIQNTSIHRKWAYRQLFHCVRKEYNSDTSLLLPNLLTIRTQTRFPIKDNRGDCPTEKWATHNTFLLCSNQRSVLLHLCKR